jgi:hypothetical protein
MSLPDCYHDPLGKYDCPVSFPGFPWGPVEPAIAICWGVCWLLVNQVAFSHRVCVHPSWSRSLLLSCLMLGQEISHPPTYYDLLVSFRWIQYYFYLYVLYVLCWDPKFTYADTTFTVHFMEKNVSKEDLGETAIAFTLWAWTSHLI